MNVSVNDEQRVPITREGYRQRCRELERLEGEEHRRLSERLREARGDGDVDSNAALVDLLDEQSRLERRIAMLKAQLAVAEIARPRRDGRAGVGSVVRVRDAAGSELFDYELVGPFEGDATNGRISTASPIGRALLGQRAGARVEVATPRGTVTLDVLDVLRASRAVAKEAA